MQFYQFMGRLVFLLPMCLLATGCSTTNFRGPQELVPHMINVDREGHYVDIQGESDFDPYSGERRYAQQLNAQSRTQCPPDPYPEHINRIFKEIKADGQIKEIVIFIHGGLVTRSQSLTKVIAQTGKIKDQRDDIYPIFINWRSGYQDSYKDHLAHVRNGHVYEKAPLSSPLYLVTDLAQAIVGTPKSWVTEANHALDSSKLRAKKYIQNARHECRSQHAELLSNVQFHCVGNPAKTIYEDKKRSLLWTLTGPAKLVTTPLTNALGKPAWNIMQRRTKTLFDISSGKIREKNICIKADRISRGDGALSQFMLALEGFLLKHKGQYKVNLVGHSMGAIAVAEILNRFPDLKVDNIVFMAAAVSSRNALNAVVPYLNHYQHTQFYNLILAPQNEEYELSAYGLVPSGSLLVWIDNMFEQPDTVLDRTFGRWGNFVSTASRFPDSTSERVHVKLFGYPDGQVDEKCSIKSTKDKIKLPQKHGDFDNCPFWDKQFWWK